MKNRIFSLALALLMLLTLFSGCGKAESENSTVQPTQGGSDKPGSLRRTELIIGVSSDVVSPDPHDQNDTNSARVIRMMYDSLLYTDIDGTIKPALAESWERVSDTEVRFKLREDVKFHSGDNMTSDDVVFSLERQKNSPKVKSFVESISSVTAEDDYTVMVTTSKPYAPLLYNLSLPQSSIISKKHCEQLEKEGKKYLTCPVGTGPMKYSSWMPNNSFVVERFDDYWSDKAVATKIEVRVIPESSSRTIALETGEIDIIDSVPPVDIPRIVNNNNIRTVSQTSTALTYVSYNTRNAPFDDVKVRQALSSAVDKEAIIDVVCEGYAETVNTIYPPAMPSYDETLNLYPHDVERAKKLLSESGYPDGFKIDIATSGEERNKIAQLLQSDFAKIGVDLNITLLEWGAYLDFIGGRNHQMYIIGWSSGTEPDGSTSPLFHSESVGPTGNRSWYQNEELDALIEKGRATLEDGERDAIYKEIQRIVMEDAVWIPLFVRENVIATNKNLKGLIISPTEAHIYVYSYVEQ